MPNRPVGSDWLAGSLDVFRPPETSDAFLFDKKDAQFIPCGPYCKKENAFSGLDGFYFSFIWS